jgi:pSer/pThr/pTyr-binding forkhead associated (FHA) protein
MPKLLLTIDDRIINEYNLESEATIGRLPDNTIVIDNPAVSGHHARVFVDGDQVVVEDLRSKNGTYVNEQHVYRSALTSGDVLTIGKHRLQYADTNEVATSFADDATTPTMGPTTYLDTRQHRARLMRLREARASRDGADAPSDKCQP